MNSEPRHLACSLKYVVLITFALPSLCLLVASGCRKTESAQNYDEAKAQGKTVNDFPEVSVDVFKEMDGGVGLTEDEIKGRNTWLLWTAGNEAFWDYMSQHSYGLTDLLKTLDTRRRATRFREMGLVNEPGFKQAAQPDQYGLWLDERVEPEQAGIDAAIYGRSSGLVGLRLFPNPAFDEAARKRWNAERYYTDPDYFNDPALVRPYRVGMACAFCHVQMHPLHPPADPEQPQWANLSSNIGNQYMKVQPIFGVDLKPGSFLYELLNETPRGTVDTSLIASDGNNNPNAMNPLFNVGARLSMAVEEKMGEGARRLPPGDENRKVPHILMDGADCVGILGALDRVFVNIGAYHQEWIKHHNLLLGIRRQSPIEVAKMQADSVYWQATERRVENLARFFLKAAGPMRLEDAPGGRDYLSRDQAMLDRGKIVFAENCMACHSSKQPEGMADHFSEDYRKWARAAVVKQDFRDDNYFSIDQRISVRVVQTNAGRSLATNATRGHVWDNFSSETFKNSPPVGEIEVVNPFDGTTRAFQMPGGGPGYYRVPTLVSIWATAPFFHNNSLGEYTGDPSVAGRMRAFDDAATKLLWPEKRKGMDSIWRTQRKSHLQIPGAYLPDVFESITGYRSRLILVYPWLLPLLIWIVGILLFALAIKRRRFFLRVAAVLLVVLGLGLMIVSYFLAGERGDLALGPIPKGTPINLLANINTETDQTELARLVLKIKRVLKEIDKRQLDDQAASDLMRSELAPDLLRLSKSPDFIEDRGHYFGTNLPDEDKRALIEFLKTL